MKITSAEKNKARHNAEIQAKQRMRELKAAQAREKARRLNQTNDDEMSCEMENDETFNADDGKNLSVSRSVN